MNASSKQVAAPGGKAPKPKFSIIEQFASKHAIAPERVLGLLRATAFRVKKGDPVATDEELLQLMIVARVYNLNPFLRELYAYRAKDGTIVPIIGVDGWIRIVEAQPHYMGEKLVTGFDDTLGPDDKPLGFYAECTMYRSDRQHPITRRAYHKENVRETDPWRNMPVRMLGHRAYIQTARAAFGLGGIYDTDEGEVIALGGGADLLRPSNKAATQAPQSTTAEEPFVTDDQLLEIKERLAKTGVQDNLLLARFEIGDFNELRSHQVPEVLKFIADNAP